LAISLDYTTLDKGLINFVSLHPVAAFSFGLQAIGDLEDFGVGVNKNTFRYSDHPSGYAMSDSVKMLVVDSIVWGILAWYLNRVVRGDYGQPLPLSFPFQVEYWCPRRIKSRQEGSGIPEEEALSDRTGVTHLFEDVSDALKEQKKEGRSVELYNLTKQFGPKSAVDRCTLSMYSGQVTALLGHNGAGKSNHCFFHMHRRVRVGLFVFHALVFQRNVNHRLTYIFVIYLQERQPSFRC
jgi:ABC-type multidrug transport system fused ATPase/permease subunit